MPSVPVPIDPFIPSHVDPFPIGYDVSRPRSLWDRWVPNPDPPDERTPGNFSMLQDGISIPRDTYRKYNGDASSVTPERGLPPWDIMDPELLWSFDAYPMGVAQHTEFDDWMTSEDKTSFALGLNDPSKNYLKEEFWDNLENVNKLNFPEKTKKLALEVETKILRATKIVPTSKGNFPSVSFVRSTLAGIRFLTVIELTQKEWDKFKIIIHTLLLFTSNNILEQLNSILEPSGGKRTKRQKRRKKTKKYKSK